MDPRAESIRQDIDSIRSSMTDKVDQIETRIKDSVENTAETIRSKLDIDNQFEQHPWRSIGVAVAVGYTLGSLSSGESDHDRRHDAAGQSYSSMYTSTQSHPRQQRSGGGFMHRIADEFGEELELLRTAAVTSLVYLIQDTLKESVPRLYEEYERVRQEHGAENGRSESEHQQRFEAGDRSLLGREVGGTAQRAEQNQGAGSIYSSEPPPPQI